MVAQCSTAGIVGPRPVHILSKSMLKPLFPIILLQASLAAVSQHCDKEDVAAYLQSHVKVKADDCISSINGGTCTASAPTDCTGCDPTPSEIDVPTDKSRFPLGYLSCTGEGACQLTETAKDEFYDFTSSDDYLTCSGKDACTPWNVNLLGAACFSGENAGRGSKFNLGSGTCTNDVCCNGKAACAGSFLTEVNTLSCRGDSACKDLDVQLEGNLYCDSGADTGACSNDKADFEFSGSKNHCIECYGKETCTVNPQAPKFGFMKTEKVKMICGKAGEDSSGTCAGALINLYEDTCIHLVCETGTCNGLSVMTYSDPTSSECWCEGLGCSGISTGTTFLTCNNVTTAQPNPCGASICDNSAACCDGTTPSCSSCGCPAVLPAVAPAVASQPAATANVVGDPHITTLDGKHYTLLQQGSFLMWAFSGYETNVPSVKHGMKKVPVDFEIFTHYSGSTSFTKAILLVDKSNGLKTPRQALELTSLDCTWRAKKPSWHDVGTEFLKLTDADGDALGAFNVSNSAGNHKNVQLLMKTEDGYRKIANVFVRCQPGSHMAAKVKMLSPKTDLGFVHGEVAPDGHRFPAHALGSASKLGLGVSLVAQDKEFSTTTEWTALGGSEDAASYLKEVDVQGPGTFLKQCGQEEQQEAEKICNKHWAKPNPEVEDATHASHAIFLADCVYDICAGGGEVAAQLTAEIMRIDS